MHDPHELLREKLNLETATLAWPELERHFARGVIVKVADGVDLIDAAVLIAQNDTPEIERWMESLRIARASDHDALAWHTNQARLWTVVVAPWVLVQERRQ
jgi:hypothetical protein